MLGALVLDLHQVRSLETMLNYVAETNPAMLTYNAPLCESLSGLANILETLKITKTG